MEDDARLRRWERRTEIPLFAASLLFLAGYAVLVLVPGMSAPWRLLWTAVTAGTWAAFAVDYVVRLALSGLGAGFVSTHKLDTLVLVLPLLRSLRLFRAYTSMRGRRERPLLDLHARVISYAGISALLLGFAASLAVYQSERGAPGATIRTFGDAVWWCAAALTTTGYGDVAPVTGRGRAIAVGAMAGGLAILGAVTGSFSSWLLQVFTREDERRPPVR